MYLLLDDYFLSTFTRVKCKQCTIHVTCATFIYLFVQICLPNNSSLALTLRVLTMETSYFTLVTRYGGINRHIQIFLPTTFEDFSDEIWSNWNIPEVVSPWFL